MPAVASFPQFIADHMDYPLAYTTAGDGVPLLLIHGSLCDYRYWRWQIPAFAQEYRVLAPSLRGYWPAAFRSRRADFDVPVQTRDLIEFLDQTCPGTPVHVLGHSRGARVALELACAAPSRVRALVLADPGFQEDEHDGPAPFQLEAASRLENGDIDGALSLFIDTVSGPDTWRHMVGWFKTMVQDNATTLLSQVCERNQAFDLARAGSIPCPTLLISGENSPARFKSIQDRLQRELPQSERASIALASHGMNLANPRAFNQSVAQFLQRHS